MGVGVLLPTFWECDVFLSIWFTYQPFTFLLFGYVFLLCFHVRKIMISHQIEMLQQQHAHVLLFNTPFFCFCRLHQTLSCSHREWRKERRGLASKASSLWLSHGSTSSQSASLSEAEASEFTLQSRSSELDQYFRPSWHGKGGEGEDGGGGRGWEVGSRDWRYER